MSSLLSKWVVLQQHDVTPEDLDAGGVVRDEAVEQWINDARAAYLECCPVLRAMSDESGFVLQYRLGDVPSGRDFGRPATVAVSAGATEIWPSAFAIAFRMRTHGSPDDVALNATCIVSLEDPATGEARELGDAVRDELIALAHAARHYN